MNLKLQEVYAAYAAEVGMEVGDMDDRDKQMAVTNYILTLKHILFNGGTEKIRRERKEQVDD